MGFNPPNSGGGGTSIGGSVGGGTSGSMLFVNSSGKLAQDNTNLSWDDAADTLTVANALIPLNGQIFVSTDKQTNTAVGLIRLHFTTNEAKAIIAYVDENNNEVIWLQAHNYLVFPTNQHKHFSVEAADAAGLKQTRLGVGYGADNVAVTVNQADLTINRNSGISPANGNIIFTGSGGGGVLMHDNAFQFYPTRGTNSSIALNIALANTSELTLSVIGSSFLYLNDGLMINTASGGAYASVLRWGGETASNFQGGYAQYDAAGNNFIIGAHNVADQTTGNDVPVLTIARTGLTLGISAATTVMSTLATPAGGTAGKGLMFGTTANFGIFYGSGAPTLSAAKGSKYLRSDGSGTNDREYINTDGGTTWTAVVTVA